MSHDPNDPVPQEDPTHDAPVYPEHDPPPEERPIKAAGPDERERHREGHSHGDAPQEEGEDDVDEDDLDPQAPHSPPDSKKGKIVFDESKVAG